MSKSHLLELSGERRHIANAAAIHVDKRTPAGKRLAADTRSRAEDWMVPVGSNPQPADPACVLRQRSRPGDHTRSSAATPQQSTTVFGAQTKEPGAAVSELAADCDPRVRECGRRLGLSRQLYVSCYAVPRVSRSGDINQQLTQLRLTARGAGVMTRSRGGPNPPSVRPRPVAVLAWCARAALDEDWLLVDSGEPRVASQGSFCDGSTRNALARRG
jgi:hypothetical protein